MTAERRDSRAAEDHYVLILHKREVIEMRSLAFIRSKEFAELQRAPSRHRFR